MAVPLRRSASADDVAAGARIRLRRMQLGISQEKLGEALGVTFQQIQKYEKGANRVATSRLKKLVTLLGCSLNFIVFGDETPTEGGTDLAAFRHPMAQEVATRFMALKDRKQVRAFMDLLRAMTPDVKHEALIE